MFAKAHYVNALRQWMHCKAPPGTGLDRLSKRATHASPLRSGPDDFATLLCFVVPEFFSMRVSTAVPAMSTTARGIQIKQNQDAPGGAARAVHEHIIRPRRARAPGIGIRRLWGPRQCSEMLSDSGTRPRKCVT